MGESERVGEGDRPAEERSAVLVCEIVAGVAVLELSKFNSVRGSRDTLLQSALGGESRAEMEC